MGRRDIILGYVILGRFVQKKTPIKDRYSGSCSFIILAGDNCSYLATVNYYFGGLRCQLIAASILKGKNYQTEKCKYAPTRMTGTVF